MTKCIARVYSENAVTPDGGYDGTYEIVRRIYDDGTEHVFMTFPNTKHEVWDTEHLRVMMRLLEEFFSEEFPEGTDTKESE